MMTSPFSITVDSVSIACSVILPAGSMTHTARGAASFLTMSSRPLAPVIPSPASLSTALASTSNTKIS